MAVRAAQAFACEAQAATAQHLVAQRAPAAALRRVEREACGRGGGSTPAGRVSTARSAMRIADDPEALARRHRDRSTEAPI